MVPTCWTPDQALEQFQRLFFSPCPRDAPGSPRCSGAGPRTLLFAPFSSPLDAESVSSVLLSSLPAPGSPRRFTPSLRPVRLSAAFYPPLRPSGSPRRFTLLFAGPRRVARLFTLVSTVFSAPLLSSYRSIYLSISSAALPRRNQSPALPGRRRRRMRRQCRLRGRTSV